MKTKTIKKVLKKTFNAWIVSIEDSQFKALAQKNTIITGGCIASMLLKEKVNDYDLYFTNEETVLAAAEYYTKVFNADSPIKASVEHDDEGRIKIWVQSGGVVGANDTEIDEGDVAIEPDDDNKPKYRPIFLSSNAITLSQGIQIVIRFYGDAKKIHSNFDYVHCMNYWTSSDSNLVLRQDALESLLARDLRYVGSQYPLCSVIRTRKFLNRGWTINAGQYLKMLFQVSQLDLTDVNVLEDQLIGVDTAYFRMLIDILEENGMDKVDYLYLVDIIDRIF